MNDSGLSVSLAVRLALAKSPRVALRVMLAHVIAGGTLWKVEPEPQQAASAREGWRSSPQLR